MKAFGGLFAAIALYLGASLCWAAQAQAVSLEGFDLGMSREEAYRVIEQKQLTMVYDSSEIPGRESCSFKGLVLDGSEGTLDLVLKDGKVILITANLKADTPTLQRYIAIKHQEIMNALTKQYGEKTETAGPDMVNWVLGDEVVSLYKDESKMFISAFDRVALSE